MSRKNMRQIYFRRRLLAIIILVIVVLLVFRACSSRSQNKEEETVQDQRNQIIEENNPNANLDDVENEKEDNRARVKDEDEDLDEDQEESSQEDSTSSQVATKEVALDSHIQELNDEFIEYAEVDYDEVDEAIEISITGDLKDTVDRIFENEATSSDMSKWDDFKKDVIRASESVTEQIEPGIEFKVINPGGMTEVILNVKNGSVNFDLASE